MSRTGEIVLGVISSIISLISIIGLSLLVISGSSVFQQEAFNTIIEQEILNDPTLTSQEAELFTEYADTYIHLFSFLGWGLVAAILISLVLNILGIMFITKNKNSKLAGIMFILAGLFAGVISLTSIMLYIAAIMCFVRKPPVQFAEKEY